MIVLEIFIVVVGVYLVIGALFSLWNLLNYMIGINDQRGYARKVLLSFRWPILVKEFIEVLAEDASK